MVSLSRDELKKLVQILLWLNAIIFASILLIRLFMGVALLTAVLPALSTAIFVSTMVLLFGINLTWKWRLLAWLAKRPIVHGVWWGEISPIYQGKAIPAIPIAFVIRQKYASLSIQSFTSNIPADSTIELFERSDKNTDVYLKYVYQMTRDANAENKSTIGYGRLRLELAGKVLDGSYWTNSPTSGQIRLKLVTRDCDEVNCFESAKKALEEKGFA
ncbi:hypothetical protein XaraCFBP7407_16730 [Xanthomonas arboricola pv. arracaciae]|uniref:Cap15 family cyclic dinucleotide receptor domain-containing protein n=1 Tax=Xanthomonas arboricola TaxID=56448 RepID=UPI000CEDA852|nr:hypothetical protein [Xanthomonas arboricola]PPT93842.1 hypothetical protein XaraCFBP7407_16730 [Xanthomonas arboricola pv. arracaciae]